MKIRRRWARERFTTRPFAPLAAAPSTAALVRVALVGVALAGVALLGSACGREPVVYLGGPVLTLDAENRVVEALAVEDGRIAAVGEAAALRDWAGAHGARIVDLRGAALLPGFIDAHGHFPGAGLDVVIEDLNAPPIGEVRSIEELLARLRVRAEQGGVGDWVLGSGYDDTLLAERRHPTRTDLDLVSRERPVGILHVSGHLAAVNGAGLARLGIARDTPDPEGGRIRRDPESGEPDGVLEETAAEAFTQEMFALSPLQGLRVARRAAERYLAAGVTTAQSGYATPEILRGLGMLSRLGLLPLRLVLWPADVTADAMLEGRLAFTSYDPEWLRVGAVKIVADGSIQGYTGYLSEPYTVPPGDDPGYRGYPRVPRDELFARVARFHEAGLQVAVHGNGDAAIDDILDAFAAAQRVHPRADARHVLVHAQMARDDQLDRMRELAVIPSFFSLHTYYWGDRHRDVFMGPERAARMSPARSALERGVRFTIHADCPVVPMEPLRLVWSAVNRRSTSGASIGAGQRIGVMQALRAVTIDAAYQHFEEELKGSLEVGKLADLVVLGRNPLDDPATIDRIRVLQTVVGGETVYSAEAGAASSSP